MASKLTISVSDWVFEQIESLRPKSIGRSEFVEELIRIGLEKQKEAEQGVSE